MSYISYRDFFKDSNDGFGDYRYTIADAGAGGAIASNHPITLAQDRNLGTVFRWTTEAVRIDMECTNVFSQSDRMFFPTCVCILGHNLGKLGAVLVNWKFRNGSDLSYNQTAIDLRSVKMNNMYFVLRERLDDTPYKVEITILQPPIPVEPSPDFIDIGRVWVGNAWDTDNPLNNERGMMDGNWKTGFIEGADSKLTRGNQSFSNRLAPLKTVDFTLDVRDSLQDFLGEDGGLGILNSLNEDNSLVGFNQHLQQGGSTIVMPYEAYNATNDNAVYGPRLGLYGESAKASNDIMRVAKDHYRADFKIRQLQ